MTERCAWCGTDPLYVEYHDTEWGVPEYDARALWEKLILDGFQAGLSWITILRKRDAFRSAFEGFDPAKVARWGEADVQRLREVGFSDEHVVEILAHVALNLFTNYVNVALAVPVDFPAVKLRRAA